MLHGAVAVGNARLTADPEIEVRVAVSVIYINAGGSTVFVWEGSPKPLSAWGVGAAAAELEEAVEAIHRAWPEVEVVVAE